MKKVNFLVWFGLGGILSFTIGQFIKETDWRINYFIWISIIIAGSVISAKESKKSKE